MRSSNLCGSLTSSQGLCKPPHLLLEIGGRGECTFLTRYLGYTCFEVARSRWCALDAGALPGAYVREALGGLALSVCVV